MPGRGEKGRTEPRPSPRNKRAEIVAVATEYFGEDGYEDTKWADVATAVGLGPTALYHYFESKQQCLFEILAEAIEDFHAEFLRIGGEQAGFDAALPAVLRAGFELNDREVRRNRLAGRRAGAGPPPARGAARGGGAGSAPTWRASPRGGHGAISSPAGWRPRRSPPPTQSCWPA